MPDSLRDPASGLLNEPYFRVALPDRVATSRRSLEPLSLVLLVADDDAPVAPLAHALLDTLREADTACRLRDGRVALLLEATPEDGAVWTVERVRRLLTDQGAPVTIWAGVATYPAHALEAPELLDRAARALDDARAWTTSRIEVATAG